MVSLHSTLRIITSLRPYNPLAASLPFINQRNSDTITMDANASSLYPISSYSTLRLFLNMPNHPQTLLTSQYPFISLSSIGYLLSAQHVGSTPSLPFRPSFVPLLSPLSKLTILIIVGFLITSLLDKSHLSSAFSSDAWGSEGPAAVRARVVLFIGVALMAGGLAGSLVSSRTTPGLFPLANTIYENVEANIRQS